QLTHIFGKLGLSSQTELALFLATLTQLMTKERRPSDIGKHWLEASGEELSHHQIRVEGRDVAYLKYGRAGGIPVLILHSTTPPQMTPEFRNACTEADLQIIAVHKPGSGGSSVRPGKHGPMELASDYLAVLHAEGLQTAFVAGHCSAGLYALQFARSYPECCKGLILIDTGVPFGGRRELMALPKSLRRTFLPARYIPEILIVPHRIFAANFRHSPAGEARVVDYFFEGCPVDQNLTRTDRTYYEITRQIIEYSFQDVDRLVADVCRWAKDWSGLLEAVTCPIVFCHGEENRLFESQKILDLAKTDTRISAVISEGNGQLQVYKDGSAFPKAIERLSAGN
ncbi:MAG: alpha/beta hydrolase, partial [Pseudomonadota bacterium]